MNILLKFVFDSQGMVTHFILRHDLADSGVKDKDKN